MHKLFCLLFLAVALSAVFRYGYKTYWNSGGSMAPTVRDGQFLLINKIYYDYAPVSRFDVVALWDVNEKESLIKRIVGLPNDTVEIRDGRISINGKPIQNDPMENAEHDWQFNFGPHKLKSNAYFYIGDDRDESTWGIVQLQNIAGIVMLK